MKLLAAVSAGGFASMCLLLLSLWTSPAVLALMPLLSPLFIDAALAGLTPVEQALARKYVIRAERRLRDINPRIVAVTGSYGKTTTKEYIRHLTASVKTVLASPASYNNQAGLSRTINEHLVAGTDVLVAEVGTYKPGEIRNICRWLKPHIGIITAIGPVHLERMRTIDNIVRAKAEIFDTTETAILNIDFPELEALAAKWGPERGLIRCSTTTSDSDVFVYGEDEKLVVVLGDEHLATVESAGAHPGNVACAVAAAIEVGVPRSAIAAQLASLPSPAHRQQVSASPHGTTIIDNTYNSNPDAAKRSLEILKSYGDAQRRIVVTPGIVELGRRQACENETLGRASAEVATDLVIVGLTNRSDLKRGARAGAAARVHLVANREEAVKWVRGIVGEGDVVLYENDLPDHYP